MKKKITKKITKKVTKKLSDEAIIEASLGSLMGAQGKGLLAAGVRMGSKQWAQLIKNGFDVGIYIKRDGVRCWIELDKETLERNRQQTEEKINKPARKKK